MGILRTAAGRRDVDTIDPSPAPGRRPTGTDLTALALLTLTGTTVGGWALLDPVGFYLRFPGLGRHWVMPDGPFNEHLVRDVGALNLALGALALAAAVRLIRARDAWVVRVTGLVWLVFSVPHLLYHLDHTARLSGADTALQTTSLGLVVGLALLLVRPRR